MPSLTRRAGYLTGSFAAGMLVVDSLARLDGWQGHTFLQPFVASISPVGMTLVFWEELTRQRRDDNRDRLED